MRSRFALLVAMIVVPVATAAGQNAAPRNVITIQPLTAMLTIYSGEYERGVSKSVSFGFGGTYWNAEDDQSAINDFTYTSGDVKLRYYPMGASLNGFAIGGSVGFASVKGTSALGTDETGSGATFGVLLEYQWLMGSRKNFALAMGGGVKALMVDENKFSGDVAARYPTARVSVGYSW